MEIVQALIRFLQTARPPGLVTAYLFGSHVTGRAHRESDVAVGALLDRTAFPTDRDRCADVATDHAYVRDVQGGAADLDSFLRWRRRRQLAALAL